MIEEVASGLFRVEVPLPRNPLKSINSYFVLDDERPLVVDTGMNRPECRAALDAAFTRLGVALGRTDFLITHLHADHLGLVSELAEDGATVYFNAPELELLERLRGQGLGYWRAVGDGAIRHGFPPGDVEYMLQNHPGIKYAGARLPKLTPIRDGDVLERGGYRFTCIETPGHTPGHTCLYESEKGLLISGDHVLGDITPNISSWSDEGDALGDYLASLRRVRGLAVTLVLPGHRNPFKDLDGRIAELERHHEARLQETLDLLGRAPQTVYEVASRMTWDFAAPCWDAFPAMQRWFAAGEAAAHVRYLERRGTVRRESASGRHVFTRADG